MKTHYLPKRDGDLNSFEKNFLDKLETYIEVLGISASDMGKAQEIIESHKTAFAAMNAKKSESKSFTEGNALKKTAALDEIRRMGKVIKGSQKYTTEIGAALGLIGSEIPFVDHSDSKPILKAKIDGNSVVIQFKKKGTDGIKLYSKRGGETDFKFTALDTSSPYVDSREKIEPGKPELREYYAFYFDEDVEVGVRSNIIKSVIP